LPGLILEIGFSNHSRKVTVKNISFNSKNINVIDISKGILVPDKDDVILFRHKNKKFIKKVLRKGYITK